jgi:hypothetical protein
MGEKGAKAKRQKGKKAKRPNWPNLNLKFYQKILLLAINLKLEIKSTMVSKLKKQ